MSITKTVVGASDVQRACDVTQCIVVALLVLEVSHCYLPAKR